MSACQQRSCLFNRTCIQQRFPRHKGHHEKFIIENRGILTDQVDRRSRIPLCPRGRGARSLRDRLDPLDRIDEVIVVQGVAIVCQGHELIETYTDARELNYENQLAGFDPCRSQPGDGLLIHVIRQGSTLRCRDVLG